MSIERAMVAQWQSRAMAGEVRSLIAREMMKGCAPALATVPVSLEPPFVSLAGALRPEPGEEVEAFRPEAIAALASLTRLPIWPHPDEDSLWRRSESFLKQLSDVERRVGFEIVANGEGAECVLLCGKLDAEVVATAFAGQFPKSTVSEDPAAALARACSQTCQALVLRDYSPAPPYTQLLTGHHELKTSPLRAFLAGAARLPSNMFAFYQCLFQPAAPWHNWHHNVETLVNLEYRLKRASGVAVWERYARDDPSDALLQKSKEVVAKAHSDKPFFFTAVRVGIIGERVDKRMLAPVASFMSLYRRGGRGLEHLSVDDYGTVLPRHVLPSMLLHGATYRPGFLTNSLELASLVHLFPVKDLADALVPIRLPTIETLPVRGDSLSEGTLIGVCNVAGTPHPVCIPKEARRRSTHIIAASGMGKSTVIQRMALQDMEGGSAVIVIDAHGDTVRDLLRVIPRRHHARCIYLDFGDPDWIPIWNPLILPPGADVYRLADNLVSCFRRVFQDWGARLEHVIRNGIIGLSYLESACLADLYTLTRRKSQAGERLRKQIVSAARDETVRAFWDEDFPVDYRSFELQSPRHKISKIYSGGEALRLMFSQSENRISLAKVMDEGMILLVDLSSLGQEVLRAMGGVLLELILVATVSRAGSNRDREGVSLFIDESHLFVSADAIENLLTQARKFGVDLCLAHHLLRQFDSAKVSALSMAGCTIIGRIDRHDGNHFAKDLRGVVEPADLTRLEPFEMVVRTDKEVVRVRTSAPPAPSADACPETILRRSRERYYRRAAQLRWELAKQQSHGRERFVDLGRPENEAATRVGEPEYDDHL